LLFSPMEASQKYPNLSRYCYSWDWLVQFRVHKPKKQKKEWIDWTEVLGTNADDALNSLGFLRERKGWTLLEAYYLKPTSVAFAFDRDGPDNELLTKEQKRQHSPRPEAWGSEYRPLTAAQRQQRQEQRRKLAAASPFLAAELIAAEFP
jgi:hypothetical protein